MAKIDLTNTKPIGMGWYDCRTCAVGTIPHFHHDGPYVRLTAGQIDAWWSVRDIYPSAREWYNAQG